MWKLIPTLIASIIFAVLTERTSLFRLGENGEKQFFERFNLCFFILILVMTALVGLRTSYNDTSSYIHSY